MGFQDPEAHGATILNHLVNFGWEYVWHCHILAHEENDLMHAIIFAVAPEAPSNLLVTMGVPVTLTWTDNSANEIAFIVQRALNDDFTVNLTNFTIAGSANGAAGGTMVFADNTAAADTHYYYRVMASNVVGETTEYEAPSIGFPNMNINSAFTNVGIIGGPKITKQPSDQVISVGQTATFSVTATGTEPLSYRWQKNGLDIPGATGASYTTPPATLHDNGATYRVNVTNILGYIMSNSATQTVTPANIIRNPVSKVNCQLDFLQERAGEFQRGISRFPGEQCCKT